MSALLEAALLCSDARVVLAGGAWRVEGDPTEGALVAAAAKAGIERARVARRRPRLDALPFESERRFMATLHAGEDAGPWVVIKGAPEEVIARSDGLAWQGEWSPDALLARADEMAGRGQRVLAVATKLEAGAPHALEHVDLQGGFTVLGLIGLFDPPREEAVRAVAACHTAGIRVAMMTGDHPRTAAEVARAVGIEQTLGGALTGADLDRLSDDELAVEAAQTSVFARVAPEHKLRLVTAMQRQGEVVAMTGDGVNDAPALKQADIGIAMGISGTDVSKEAADMVLRDDNFATIESAVEEGRRVYDNLLKSIVFILPTSAGVSLLVLLAIALGLTLPILPVQILWINLVTTVALALPLALEALEPDTMQRPPRRMERAGARTPGDRADRARRPVHVRRRHCRLRVGAGARRDDRGGPNDRDRHDRLDRGVLPAQLPIAAAFDARRRIVQESRCLLGHPARDRAPARVHVPPAAEHRSSRPRRSTRRSGSSPR